MTRAALRRRLESRCAPDMRAATRATARTGKAAIPRSSVIEAMSPSAAALRRARRIAAGTSAGRQDRGYSDFERMGWARDEQGEDYTEPAGTTAEASVRPPARMRAAPERTARPVRWPGRVERPLLRLDGGKRRGSRHERQLRKLRAFALRRTVGLWARLRQRRAATLISRPRAQEGLCAIGRAPEGGDLRAAHGRSAH